MANIEDSFRAYFDKIFEIQQKSEKIKENDLRSIAEELGIDWTIVQQTFDKHIERGKGYMEHEVWEDAIEEYQQALTLQPYQENALNRIAWAYYRRWEEKFNPKDRIEAEKYAKLCLEINPSHSDALDLIALLRNKGQKEISLKDISHNFQNPSSYTASTSKNKSLAVIAGLAILVISMLVFVFIPRESEYNSDREDILQDAEEQEEQQVYEIEEDDTMTSLDSMTKSMDSIRTNMKDDMDSIIRATGDSNIIKEWNEKNILGE